MKRLNLTISKKSINNAIKQLNAYKESLAIKNEYFISKLLDEGISIAEVNKGFYGMSIIFEKKVEGGSTTVGWLIGRDAKKILSVWNRKGQVVSAEISPILFAEFGSGWLAESLFSVSGVGQGTFPGQTHALEPGGWDYKTLDGQWHHSTGFKPSHPMYKAEMEMLDRIETVAKEVFSNDL